MFFYLARSPKSPAIFPTVPTALFQEYFHAINRFFLPFSIGRSDSHPKTLGLHLFERFFFNIKPAFRNVLGLFLLIFLVANVRGFSGTFSPVPPNRK